MSTDDTVRIRALPGPLSWLGTPEAWSADEDGLTIRAAARTDWFIDPEPGAVTLDAPALLMPVEGSWMLSARVSADHRATFDAAVLVIHVSQRVWAKLCLERSPDGELMVVSVVTNGRSDDCNSVTVPTGQVWLRISRPGRAYAFHASDDGRRWSLVRHFGLDDDGQVVRVGFLGQSPTGEGCSATFRDIAFVRQRLADIRSGA